MGVGLWELRRTIDAALGNKKRLVRPGRATFFSAAINYTNYACNPTAAQLPVLAQAATMNDDLYFLVQWNSAHVCTQIQLTNASSLK